MIFILQDSPTKTIHLFSTLSKTLHKLSYILFFNAITTNKAVIFLVKMKMWLQKMRVYINETFVTVFELRAGGVSSLPAATGAGWILPEGEYHFWRLLSFGQRSSSHSSINHGARPEIRPQRVTNMHPLEYPGTVCFSVDPHQLFIGISHPKMKIIYSQPVNVKCLFPINLRSITNSSYESQLKAVYESHCRL